MNFAGEIAHKVDGSLPFGSVLRYSKQFGNVLRRYWPLNIANEIAVRFAQNPARNIVGLPL